MTWRDILEREHRLLYEVLDAAEKECDRIDASGCARIELVGDMIEFFRYFGDGLHDPKEEGLLYARCHKRGMTNEDEPLEQMLGEHEWCRAQLDALQDTLDAIKGGKLGLVRELSTELREYVEVNRCHMEVEETAFFDLATHYLTEKDLDELTEEFEAVHYDEVEEGVQEFYESLAHRVLEAETEACG
jgi:hemerythrin-like domain-containing protein